MVVLVQQCSVLKLRPATVPLDIMVLLVKINAPVAKMLALRNVGVVTVSSIQYSVFFFVFNFNRCRYIGQVLTSLLLFFSFSTTYLLKQVDGVHVLVHVNVLMDGMDHFVRMQMDVKIQYSHSVQFVVQVCMQRLLVVPLVLNVHEERMDNPIV